MGGVGGTGGIVYCVDARTQSKVRNRYLGSRIIGRGVKGLSGRVRGKVGRTTVIHSKQPQGINRTVVIGRRNKPHFGHAI